MIFTKWLNECRYEQANDSVTIYAPDKTDFFCRLKGHGESVLNAPFLYVDVEGDFVLSAKVSVDFKNIYDSVCIMVMQDLQTWGKICFEKTYYKTTAAVSVVTNQTSDDANGPDVNSPYLWIKVARKGPRFAFHYSADGRVYYMLRLFYLPVAKAVKVGLLAQAPLGEGGRRCFEALKLEHKTVEDLHFI